LRVKQGTTFTTGTKKDFIKPQTSICQNILGMKFVTDKIMIINNTSSMIISYLD